MLTVFILVTIAFALLAFSVCMGLVFYAGGMANGPAGRNAATVSRLNTLFIAPSLTAPLCLMMAIWSYVDGKGYQAMAWYLAWVAVTVGLYQWVQAGLRRQPAN